MKKLLTITFGCALMLALSACQKPLHSSENNSSTAITSSETSGLVSTPISVSEPQTTYSVVFLNYDNSLLYEATGIERGKPAIYRGPTPVRPETDEYKYEFVGWDKNITAIYSDLAAIAQYTATKKNATNPYNPVPAEGYDAVPNENGMELAFAGIFEDHYYAYYFDIGVVETTPVYSSMAVKYMYQNYQITFEFDVCTTENLSHQMSTATQTIHTDSTTTGFSFAPEVGIKDKFSLKVGSFDHHWTHEDTVMRQNSEDNIESYTKTYGEGYKIVADLSEQNGFRREYTYRFSFFETIKCYGVLLYDFDKNEYSYFYQTLLDTSSKTMLLEESSNKKGEFNYEINSHLEFDLAKALEIAKKEEYKFDKRVRLDNQNGKESLIYIYVDKDGNYRGTKPTIPVNEGKIFLGYFSKKELGQGDCYLDADLIVKREININIVLFAHWAEPSHSVTNHHASADNVYKSNGNTESNWDGLWKGESPIFPSGFKTEEAIDAVKGGYKFVKVHVRMDTYEETDGWEWVAFRAMKNNAFYCNLQIYKISVVTKDWKSVGLDFTFDANYLTDSSISYQLVYGVSGNKSNEWKRGYTATDMTLVKEAINPSATEIIDGGPYTR